MDLQARLKELENDNKRLRQLLIEAWGFVPGEDRGRCSSENCGSVASDDRSAARWIGQLEDSEDEE
jgi:hypothetical protein